MVVLVALVVLVIGLVFLRVQLMKIASAVAQTLHAFADEYNSAYRDDEDEEDQDDQPSSNESTQRDNHYIGKDMKNSKTHQL